MSRCTTEKNAETYKFKYIVKTSTNQLEILSNLPEQKFSLTLTKLSLKNEYLEGFKIEDCIEFEYSDICDGLKLEQFL